MTHRNIGLPFEIALPGEFPELRTANLRLRELVPADADDVFRIFSDPEVTRYYDFETFTTVDQAGELIDRQRIRFENREAIRWGITYPATNIVIGTVGYALSHASAMGGLGYDLASAYWRRGIMSEALALVIRFGFKALRLNRIQALVVPGNEASAGLLARLGFTEEGLLREYAFFRGRFQNLRCFSLLSREYVPPQTT